MTFGSTSPKPPNIPFATPDEKETILRVWDHAFHLLNCAISSLASTDDDVLFERFFELPATPENKDFACEKYIEMRKAMLNQVFTIKLNNPDCVLSPTANAVADCGSDHISLCPPFFEQENLLGTYSKPAIIVHELVHAVLRIGDNSESKNNCPPNDCPGGFNCAYPYGYFAGVVPHFTIMSLHSGLCLDVEDHSMDERANIVQWEDNGGRSQQWQFIHDYIEAPYVIKNRNSGLVFDVEWRSTSAGKDIVQWSNNGGENQQWLVQRVSEDAYYKFTSVNSGLLADVYDKSISPGAKVIQWPDNGQANQIWKLAFA